MGDPTDTRVTQRTRSRVGSQRREQFRLVGVRTSVANALRRIILSEIPYVGAYRDEARAQSSLGGFVVRVNTGKLHNDMLVDRLALTPIYLSRAEIEQYIPGSVTVELNVHNDGSGRMDVTSRNLRARLFGKPHPNASACYPPNPISGDWPLITRLYPGERIDVTATLEKNVASTHTAFAVASAVGVVPSPDEEACVRERERIESSAASDVERSRALNFFDHITRKRLVKRGPDGEPEWHEIDIESESGLSPGEILEMARATLREKFVSSALAYESKVVPSSVTRAGCIGVVYTIAAQGHTFGSVIQDVCMSDREELGLLSVGYYKIHPLEERIVVRVDLPAPEDPGQVISRMRAHCAHYIEGISIEAKGPGDRVRPSA